MWKKVIIAMLAVMLIGVVVAGYVDFPTKVEAWNYFKTYKADREADIDKISSQVTITTDKMCTINYDKTPVDADEPVVSCNVCFTYTHYYGAEEETCTDVPEDSTDKEVEALVKKYVDRVIRLEYPLDTVRYSNGGIQRQSFGA
jgi:L-lysine 2,3-aminomutase